MDDLLTDLEKHNPGGVQELRLLLDAIRQKETSTGYDFAGVRSPRKAIELCIVEKGAPMSKRELVDRLLQGGFINHVDTERWLINDAVNLGVRKGVFVVTRNAEKWDLEIALPFMPDFHQVE